MEFHMTVEYTVTYWQQELAEAINTYKASKANPESTTAFIEFNKSWIDFCGEMVEFSRTLETLHSDVQPQEAAAQTIQAHWNDLLANDDEKLTKHVRVAHVANTANVSIQKSIAHVGYSYVLHTATSTAIIEPNGDYSCTCKDHQYRKSMCKHLYVLSLSITNPTF